MVFTEISGPSTQAQDGSSSKSRSHKVKQRGDLEDEFGMTFAAHEGQAAEQGVFFDDTSYDYMQHMRDLGSEGVGSVTWLEAPQEKKAKGKGKMRLEDALRSMDIRDDASEGGVSLASTSSRSLLPEDVLPSEFVKKTTYQDMQDVPDAIAGFQPDMDPRLREALEALDDEAYVDEEDDIFAELGKDAEEVDEEEFEATFWDQMDAADGQEYGEDDDGWESDATIKADDKASSPSPAVDGGSDSKVDFPPPADTTVAPPSDPTDGAWLEEFTKFKKDVKAAKALPARNTPSAYESSIQTGLSSLASGRRKKRKGALTSTTNYSMTSSALARTEPQSLLDARFDKIEEEYADDGYMPDDFDDSASLASGMTGMTGASRVSGMTDMSRASGISTYSRATDSEAPQLVRSDFDSIMDEFIGGHSKQPGRGRRIKKSGFQTGMQQLDEIRQGLGPARFGAGKTRSARA